MKIFVLPSWYPPAGGEFFVHQTHWLMEAGLNCTVITVEEKSLKTFSPLTLLTDLKVSRGSEFGIPTYRKKQFRIPKAYRLNTRVWISMMTRLTEMAIHDLGLPDLIQVHSCLFGGAVAARIKEKYGVPYVITEHRGRFNLNNRRSEKNLLPWFGKYLRQGLVRANHLIPVSELLIKRLEVIAGSKLNCTVIPNPVDDTLFRTDPAFRSEPERTKFLSVSAFMPVKGLDILVHAFARAVGTNRNLYLDFVGDGEEKIRIQKLVADLQIESHVKFHGFLNKKEVSVMMQQCDFLVLPSLTEAQPVVISEAMLCGKPLIVSDVVSSADVPDYAGYVVPAGETEPLATALAKAHSEKSRFNPGQIRSFAVNRYARSNVILKIAGIFRLVIDEEKQQHDSKN